MQLWACNQRVSELQGAFHGVANTHPKEWQIQEYQNYSPKFDDFPSKARIGHDLSLNFPPNSIESHCVQSRI